MAAWSAGLGVAISILAVAFISWGMSDIDGDGLASFDEMGQTRPMNGDSDGDGASDGWERVNGFSPMTADRFELAQANPTICDDLPGGLGQSAGDCGPEGAQTESQAYAEPSTTAGRAQTMTIVMAIAAVALGALGGIFTGRTIIRRGL